jgi:hypothetical protein
VGVGRVRHAARIGKTNDQRRRRAFKKDSRAERIGALRRREHAFEHGALGMVRANTRMRTIKRVHLIDQLNAERLVFRTGAGRACRHQRRECDAHCNALKRSHDYPPGQSWSGSGVVSSLRKIAPTVINLS